MTTFKFSIKKLSEGLKSLFNSPHIKTRNRLEKQQSLKKNQLRYKITSKSKITDIDNPARLNIKLNSINISKIDTTCEWKENHDERPFEN